jgi:hypothetical protein
VTVQLIPVFDPGFEKALFKHNSGRVPRAEAGEEYMPGKGFW